MRALVNLDAAITILATTAPERMTATADPATESLVAHLDTCPTCFAWHDVTDVIDDSATPCPTCGQASVEWTLATEIDALLTSLNGFERLGAALRQE